jgi:hypothetical protein
VVAIICVVLAVGFTRSRLQDVAHDIFLRVMEFLYVDVVSDMSPDTAVMLLIASEQ